MQVIAASAAIGAGVCSIFKGSPRFGLAISALAAGTGFMWYNAAELIAKAQSSKITTAAAAHTELEIKKAG
jgi:UDP-N-acetylmuramyl pentapeptide phosphotransferase/UDP-N-acetylglucosamine-1-phosphate transferase